MSENKRYYWLKLPENFFDAVDDETISYIEEMEGGQAYVLFYLKLLCKALRTDGVLIRYIGTNCIPYDDTSLARLTNTPVDTVHCAVKVLMEVGLLRRMDSGELFLTQMKEFAGSETDKAIAMRKSRAKARLESGENPSMKAKSNAERQRAFRAKQYVEKQPHVPFIEDYQNRIRYNGNYYIVFRRDGCKCSMCGGTDNLCIHHIDGYDEEKLENSNENKMLTLCRSCHIQVHRSGLAIPEDILERIGYYDSNESNEDALPNRYPDVTQSKRKSKEIDIEKEREEETSPVLPPYMMKIICHEKGASESLTAKIVEWCEYRIENYGDEFLPKRFNSIVSNVLAKSKKHGEDAVIDQIGTSIREHWKGMNLDKLDKKEGKRSGGRFNQMEQQDYDFEALEKVLTGGNDGQI